MTSLQPGHVKFVPQLATCKSLQLATFVGLTPVDPYTLYHGPLSSRTVSLRHLYT